MQLLRVNRQLWILSECRRSVDNPPEIAVIDPIGRCSGSLIQQPENLDVEANLFLRFSHSRCLGRLSWLNPAAWKGPKRLPTIRLLNHQHVAMLKQDNTRSIRHHRSYGIRCCDDIRGDYG